MTQRRSPWRLIATCVLMAVAAAGCYQTNGDNAQTTQVSAFIPSFTPLPTETFTPSPTQTPFPVATAEAVAPTEEIEIQDPDDAIVDQPVSDIGGQEVAQGDLGEGEGVQDEFILTATQYVLEITQTASYSETQTAIFLGIGATETPFLVSTPTPEVPLFISTATPGGLVQQPVNPGGTCVHEVRAGENLFRLSMTYGVSVADLASASGIINPQLILVGQRINVPGCGTTGVFPPATSQPTVAFDNSAQVGGTGGSTTGQTVQVQLADGTIAQGTLLNGGQGGGATFTGRTHVVQQYETLFQISQQYGVSVNSIAAANGISNINIIIMGDTLNIPAQ